MIKFGDYVVYDGLIYRVVGISEDAEPTYTLEPVRTNEKPLSKMVVSSQTQVFLVPSGGANIEGVEGTSLTPIGSRTATVSALQEGYVRVKFESNGGSDVPSQIIEVGELATEPEAPTKEGYVFEGWFTDDETFLVAYVFATPVADDITLYAKWT